MHVDTRCIANTSALFADNLYQCNVDLFVKTETLLSDNDTVICNAIASPGFKLYLIVPRVLVKVRYASSVYFFNSFMEYDSYNTSTTIKIPSKSKIQHTAKTFIEREKQTKKVVDTIGLVRTGQKDLCKAPPAR